MKRNGWFYFLLVAAIMWCGVHQAQARQIWRIGTGGLLGIYYPVGKLMAEGLTVSFRDNPLPLNKSRASGEPIVVVAQVSGGSVANVQALMAGELEMALVQADVAAQAWHGQGAFSGSAGVREIRAIASLYSEKLQIVTRRDAGIRSIADLRGRHISIDEVGSGTLAVMRHVLDAHDLKESDFFPVYLKPEFTTERIRNNELQGFVIMTGTPAAAIEQIADLGILLVPVDPPIAESLSTRFQWLVPGIIPAGVYGTVSATPTVEVYALLLVRSDLEAEAVHAITAALWGAPMQSLFSLGHPQARDISLDTALNGISIPLHDGAARFYQK